MISNLFFHNQSNDFTTFYDDFFNFHNKSYAFLEPFL